MYSQEGGGNGQGEQEVTSPSYYIFEQFQNSYQFRILFTNPEKIFELLCPFEAKLRFEIAAGSPVPTGVHDNELILFSDISNTCNLS